MNMRKLKTYVSVTLMALVVFAVSTQAQEQNFDDVSVEAVNVAGRIYIISGPGGNIGVSIGEDSTFLVDDLFAPLTEKIIAAIEKVSDKPVGFIINTHWHGDHTGGNENFGKASAVIIAQENVRDRLSAGQFMEYFNKTVPPAPAAALPVITFKDDITLHLNGEDTHVFHVDSAHTDGDSIVHFGGSNVIHMGDTFFNGLYPFVDLGSGGSVEGVIAAVARVLPLIDDETKVIPGHGPVSDKAGLIAYYKMLVKIRDNVSILASFGKTLQEVIAAEPTKEFDALMAPGIVSPAQFAEAVFKSITQ